MTACTLREVVRVNLDAARENGYFDDDALHELTPYDIALDMIAYCEAVEGETPENLIPHIQEWKKDFAQ
jgi:hypothetical protein